MKTNVYGIYASSEDITFVMEEKFTDDGEPYSLEVKGFYYGEPTDTDNKLFYGDLIAKFSSSFVQEEPKTEYLLHINITVEGPHKLCEADVLKLLATMATKLDDGTTIKCDYAHHEEI